MNNTTMDVIDNNRSSHLCSVECKEPNGTYLRSVDLAILSLSKLKYYYDRLSKFRVLVNTQIKDDPDAFIKCFVAIGAYGEIIPHGLIWEVDDVGLIFLQDILPNVSASFHVSFWDRRFRGRENLVREVIKQCFLIFGLIRVWTEIPLYATAVLGAVERVGFVKEGRLRKVSKFEDKWYDVNVYSILREEIIKNG